MTELGSLTSIPVDVKDGSTDRNNRSVTQTVRLAQEQLWWRSRF